MRAEVIVDSSFRFTRIIHNNLSLSLSLNQTEVGEMFKGEVAEKENSKATLVTESRVTSKSKETAPKESRETVGGKSTISETANEGDEFTKVWPIGTPWEHLGTEDVDDSEPFEVRTRSVLLQMNTVPSFITSSNLVRISPIFRKRQKSLKTFPPSLSPSFLPSFFSLANNVALYSNLQTFVYTL